MTSGYLLCGTPRTGSTLLCGLLASTGLLGRPESYFREPDEAIWAARLRVPVAADGRVGDYRQFLESVRAAATTPNGIFAARVMWGSLGRMLQGLEQRPGQRDRAVLEAAVGPLVYVFLSREDVVAQAVSWCRAEQTGYWQPGDSAGGPPRLDVGRARDLLRVIRAHNEAWSSWFDREGIRPHEVTYEQLVGDPHGSIAGIAALLGVRLPSGWHPVPSHGRQADDLHRRWVAALRAALADDLG